VKKNNKLMHYLAARFIQQRGYASDVKYCKSKYFHIIVVSFGELRFKTKWLKKYL